MTTKQEDKKNSQKELMSLADLTTAAERESDGETIAEFSLHPKNDIESPDPSEWNDFLSHVNAYAEGAYKDKQRRSYEIDVDIAETIKGIQLSGVTRSDVFNAIIRSFLLRHRDELIPLINRPKPIF